MTRYLPILAGLLLALVAVGLAQSSQGDQPKVAYVIAGDVAAQSAAVERVRATAERTGAQLRVPTTTADQLGVTHLLAASGYDKVITLGVDRRIAVAPVAARFPDTRFVELPG
jgi:type IV secretory pathway VirJ component